MNKEQIVNLQLSEKGKKDYLELTKTLVRIFNKEEKVFTPCDPMILGFGKLQIDSDEELLAFIKLMGFLIGTNIAINKTTTFKDDKMIEIVKLEMVKNDSN